MTPVCTCHFTSVCVPGKTADYALHVAYLFQKMGTVPSSGEFEIRKFHTVMIYNIHNIKILVYYKLIDELRITLGLH